MTLKEFMINNKENFLNSNWTAVMNSVDEDLSSTTDIKAFREILYKADLMDEALHSTEVLPAWFFTEDLNLNFIDIPGNIKTIGYGCFIGCYELTEIILNEGLEKIESQALDGTSIEEIKLPKSIKKVEEDAFGSSYKDGLNKIYVPLRYISKFPERVDKVKDWFTGISDEEFEKIFITIYG